ncbi:unnamed protein product, partial [Didymodactylos carnosus]
MTDTDNSEVFYDCINEDSINFKTETSEELRISRKGSAIDERLTDETSEDDFVDFEPENDEDPHMTGNINLAPTEVVLSTAVDYQSNYNDTNENDLFDFERFMGMFYERYSSSGPIMFIGSLYEALLSSLFSVDE